LIEQKLPHTLQSQERVIEIALHRSERIMKARQLPLLLLTAATLAFTLRPATAADAKSALDLARQLNEAFVLVADQASASVVVIDVAQKPNRLPFTLDESHPFFEDFRRHFEDMPEPRRRPRGRVPEYDGQGSGIILRDGYILTNGHVVEDAEKIRVRLKDGREFPATIRGTDPQSDIAVLKIEATGLPAAKLGDSDKARVGEFAIAIGAPTGLDYSVTIGHVSAKGRTHIIPPYAGGASMDQEYIQTDASINPGNSGGPLVNIHGEVIGIITLIRGLNTGIGFAVPINLARRVADQIIEQGRYVRAWIGVSASAIEDDPDHETLAPGLKSGLIVARIMPGGPAAKSDLKPSDVITKVEGRPVKTVIDLREEVRARPMGKPLTLDVVRGGKNLKIKITPEPWPEEALTVASRATPPAPAGQALGLSVRPLTAEMADQLGVEANAGVVVSGIDRTSLAYERGLRPGDVITEINRQPVRNPREFREATKAADLKKGVIVNFIREGTSRFEVLRAVEE
jgi:serine protease Do